MNEIEKRDNREWIKLVLAYLSYKKRRCTYEALAESLPVPVLPISVAKMYLGEPRPHASRVVNKETGQPSEYKTDQIAEDVLNPVCPPIISATELKRKVCEWKNCYPLEAITADQEFHWGEGIKFAIDGIKSHFYLNGAASISVLTFIGQTEDRSYGLLIAMICFAIGALAACYCFRYAYETQLQYGNAGVGSPTARKEHSKAKCFILVSQILFTLGIVFSICGFLVVL
ncbi:MAG: hypothetical protein OXE94_14620 [Aestuariivita sp.]|nr:hypothetical protein [Aestuariivita sp.]MCY4201552.1 hypothetical protein [Aestuariivita sp.]